MPTVPEDAISVRDLSGKSRRIGAAVHGLILGLGWTFRWRVHDPGNVCGNPPDHPMVWIFWHNRTFALPGSYRRFLRDRGGAILSSASRDGEIIAVIAAKIGCAAVRGSSSRRGVNALMGLLDWIRRGYDVAVVPDGPRGPRYRLAPGVIKIAQKTEAKILPVRVEYGSFWTFKSWDRFRLPKPFTTVDIFFEPLVDVPAELAEEEFEEKRKEVEVLMNPRDETD